jgi:hypothetical protein
VNVFGKLKFTVPGTSIKAEGKLADGGSVSGGYDFATKDWKYSASMSLSAEAAAGPLSFSWSETCSAPRQNLRLNAAVVDDGLSITVQPLLGLKQARHRSDIKSPDFLTQMCVPRSSSAAFFPPQASLSRRS